MAKWILDHNKRARQLSVFVLVGGLWFLFYGHTSVIADHTSITGPRCVSLTKPPGTYSNIFNEEDRDREKYVASNLHWRGGALNQEWAVLQGYLNMYEGTRNTDYLDRFRDDVNLILNQSLDEDGYNHPGWHDHHDTGTNLVNNASFHFPDPTDRDMPLCWTGDGDVARYTMTAPGKPNHDPFAPGCLERAEFRSYGEDELSDQSTSLRINPTPGQSAWAETKLYNYLVKDNQSYEPLKTYYIEFQYKVDSDDTVVTLEIYDKEENEENASTHFIKRFGPSDITNTDWREPLIECKKSENDPNWMTCRLSREHEARTARVAPPLPNTAWVAPRLPNKDMRLRISANGTAYFDNIKLLQYADYPIYDANILVPMARFARMSDDDASGRLTRAYGALVSRIRETITDVMHKWDRYRLDRIPPPGYDGSSVYVVPDDGTLQYPNATFPYNYFLPFATVDMYMSKFDPWRFDRAERILALFKSQLRPVDNRFEWNYWNVFLTDVEVEREGEHGDSDCEHMGCKYFHRTTEDGQLRKNISKLPEDRGHGISDVYAAYIGHKYHSRVFSTTDMKKLANTFAHFFPTENSTIPRWYIGNHPRLEADEATISRTLRMSGWIYWINLDEFNPSLGILQKAEKRFLKAYKPKLEPHAYMLITSELVKRGCR